MFLSSLQVVIVLYFILVPRVDANERSSEIVTGIFQSGKTVKKPEVTVGRNSNELFSKLLLNTVKHYQSNKRDLDELKLKHDQQSVTRRKSTDEGKEIILSKLQSTVLNFVRSVVENGSNANVNAEGYENEDDNCTHPTEPLPYYNNSCEFVHAECADKAELIDYLAFICCDLAVLQVILSIIQSMIYTIYYVFCHHNVLIIIASWYGIDGCLAALPNSPTGNHCKYIN